ncbi:MAG: amidohydrolase, partial [Eubacteriales bacterium]|nr:amidohydrolase [Eubacteriales bacterium]
MLVIRNARVFTAAGATYDKADIAVNGGKIAAVGPELPIPEGAEVLDAAGLFAMPGIVDAHSHIGGFGPSPADQDLNEMTCNATPAVEAFYAIDTASAQLKRACRAGITTSVIAPGSGNVIGGLVCACKSAGESIRDMCVKNPVALKMALGGNPKGVYGAKQQLPMTRMGIAQVIYDHLKKAQEYMRKQADAQADASKLPPFDAGLENLCRVLRREIPIKVHCEQFDMLTTLRIAEEFNILFTLDHAWGASDFLDEICSAKNLVGVIFGPTGVP